MNNEPIVVGTVLHAPVWKVWEALTDNNKMKQWYFDLPAFKPEVGFQFQFTGGTEEHQYLHLCKITEAIPEKKLAYTWMYENVPVETVVSFELFEEAGNKTRIRLTHDGVENFPKNNPDFAKQNFIQGWTEIVNNSLKEFVEKGS